MSNFFKTAGVTALDVAELVIGVIAVLNSPITGFGWNCLIYFGAASCLRGLISFCSTES
jgi:hypothetical protein